eukprot:CAMPEP_0182425972 /NCGR_PEP_ID=MMETSP1167-20130531/12451_1 /TAXON_ID=2988 /ORGANISM="Mallomonas Sp, Strain CCMP3275" /LENGTH=142 /DNA_ID=CAMNT_0024607079 /DNA_START=1742 /DNA_END=2170 /DNA_ORIENTATION=+
MSLNDYDIPVEPPRKKKGIIPFVLMHLFAITVLPLALLSLLPDVVTQAVFDILIIGIINGSAVALFFMGARYVLIPVLAVGSLIGAFIIREIILYKSRHRVPITDTGGDETIADLVMQVKPRRDPVLPFSSAGRRSPSVTNT